MNAPPRKAARITTVRPTRHASTYEDPINVLVEKAGLIYQKIQRIPEEYVHKLHWDVLAATTKVIASPILSVKKYASASLGTAANDVKLISKVQRILHKAQWFCNQVITEPILHTEKTKLLNNYILICLQYC